MHTALLPSTAQRRLRSDLPMSQQPVSDCCEQHTYPDATRQWMSRKLTSPLRRCAPNSRSKAAASGSRKKSANSEPPLPPTARAGRILRQEHVSLARAPPPHAPLCLLGGPSLMRTATGPGLLAWQGRGQPRNPHLAQTCCKAAPNRMSRVGRLPRPAPAACVPQPRRARARFHMTALRSVR